MTMTRAILCNRCGTAYEGYNLDAAPLRDDAEKDGWLIKDIGGWIKDYCPHCKECKEEL